MGFGWMFLGYIFMFTAGYSGFDFIPDAIGFLLLYKGVRTASEHCGCFELTKRLCSFGIFASLLYTAYQAAAALRLLNAAQPVGDIVYWIYTVFIVGFTVSLLFSLAKVARETDVQKIRRRSAVGILLCGILLFGGRLVRYSAVWFESRISEKTANLLLTGGHIAEIIFIVYTLFTIFSCYMWICLEGDEDMPDTRRHKYVTPFDFYDKDKQKRGGKK